MLSWMLYEQQMIPGDLAEAKSWAEAAAAQGVVPSMTRLGMIYHNAIGVERDAAEAARWWDMAAARGDVDAQAMLGAAYQLGAGVPRDAVAALMWLLRAQAGGSALAESFLQPTYAAMSEAEIERARTLAKRPLGEPAS
jgi:TPR repeat protein